MFHVYGNSPAAAMAVPVLYAATVEAAAQFNRLWRGYWAHKARAPRATGKRRPSVSRGG